MVVLLRVRLPTDLVRQVTKIQCCLLQLEGSDRLPLADVAAVVPSTVAHCALSACDHFAQGVLLQAVRVAIRIMRLRKQWHSVIRPCMRVVTEQL